MEMFKRGTTIVATIFYDYGDDDDNAYGDAIPKAKISGCEPNEWSHIRHEFILGDNLRIRCHRFMCIYLDWSCLGLLCNNGSCHMHKH